MIVKLKFEDKEEFAQAKNQLHLLQSNEKKIDGFHDIREVNEISKEEAKTIMLLNNEYDEKDKDDLPESLFSIWSLRLLCNCLQHPVGLKCYHLKLIYTPPPDSC